MHKRFEERRNNTGMKRFIGEQHNDSEKKTSTHEYYERPLKQIKSCPNESLSFSSLLPISSNSLQPSFEQFRDIFSVPLCSEQCTQILLNLKQVSKTHVEHSETSCKRTTLCVNEGQSSSTFMSDSTNMLQPSEEQLRNLYSTPFHNKQNSKNLSKSEPVFKTLDEIPFDKIDFHTFESPSISEPVFKTLDETPFKEINSCAIEGYSNSVISPTSTVLQPSMEQFTDTNFVSLNKQDIQILSKSDQNVITSIENSKQMKFCASEQQFHSAFLPSSTNVLQFGHSISLRNEQRDDILSKSKQISETSSLNLKEEPQPLFQIKDIFIEREDKIRITSALELSFIKDFAEKVKGCIHRFSDPVELLHCVCCKLRCWVNDRRFEYVRDPDTPNQCPVFTCKFLLKGCLIACATSVFKKKARKLCAETVINTLVKLAILEKSDLVVECRPVVFTICREINTMKILEIFNKNIVKGIEDELAVIILKDIASRENIGDCMEFRVISNTVSETVTDYTCKFFINNILISYATDETNDNVRNVAAELGLIKLSNLSEYVIHEGELKKKLNHNNKKAVHSDISATNKANSEVRINNLEKYPFILNKTLFDSSVKDGIVVVEKDRIKINVHRALRTLLSESAIFCQKEFHLEVKDLYKTTSNQKYRKATVTIGGIEFGAGVAYSGDDAKTIACTKAFINMKKKYYTLRWKDEYIEGFLVNRNQVLNGEPYFKNQLKNNYAECKKVVKAFIVNLPARNTIDCIKTTGKQSSSAYKNANLSDLSNKQIFQLFKKNVAVMLKEFKESEDYCDLLFSRDICGFERCEIIKIAKKLHLFSQTMSTIDGGKVMYIRHKYAQTLPKLLQYLVRHQGHNCKFELIDASTAVL